MNGDCFKLLGRHHPTVVGDQPTGHRPFFAKGKNSMCPNAETAYNEPTTSIRKDTYTARITPVQKRIWSKKVYHRFGLVRLDLGSFLFTG